MDRFVPDMRTYRGPQTGNQQEEQSPDTVYLGKEQVGWLKTSLNGSDATWKVIASAMPVGPIVRDGEGALENMGNGDGPARGRRTLRRARSC